MIVDLSEEETAALLRELAGVIEYDRYPFHRHSDSERDRRQDPPRTGTRAAAAAETPRTDLSVARRGIGSAGGGPLSGAADDAWKRRERARPGHLMVQGVPVSVEPDAAEMASRYRADVSVLDPKERVRPLGGAGSRYFNNATM